jgi:hypothetical protein
MKEHKCRECQHVYFFDGAGYAFCRKKSPTGIRSDIFNIDHYLDKNTAPFWCPLRESQEQKAIGQIFIRVQCNNCGNGLKIPNTQLDMLRWQESDRCHMCANSDKFKGNT